MFLLTDTVALHEHSTVCKKKKKTECHWTWHSILGDGHIRCFKRCGSDAAYGYFFFFILSSCLTPLQPYKCAMFSLWITKTQQQKNWIFILKRRVQGEEKLEKKVFHRSMLEKKLDKCTRQTCNFVNDRSSSVNSMVFKIMGIYKNRNSIKLFS